jgi:hypothetical protein
MKSIPKQKLIILASFVIYPLVLMDLARYLDDSLLQSTFIPTGIFTALKVGFIVMSIISISMPWLLRKWPNINQKNSKNKILFLGYIFLVCPVIYGLVLFILGLPITEFYGFVSASVIGALVWGIYNLKEV